MSDNRAGVQQISERRGFWGAWIHAREFSVLCALILLFIIMSLASPYFFNAQNVFNVLRNMSSIAIISIGVTMVIITGGIDLSVGSILAVCGMCTARLMWEGVNPLISFIVGMIFGAALGALNGFIITKIKVNPFITTMGMMSIARGLTYYLATGVKGAVASNIPLKNPVLNFMGSGYVGPIPMPVIEMAVLVAVASYFLRYMVLGRQVYAVGSNLEAARLSGVRVESVQMFVYTLTGLMSALAGIINAGLLATAATNAGTGVELDVVAAVIIGGASLSGGSGTIYGAVIGAAIMALLRNAFVLLHLPAFIQTITIGVVLILAVASDNLRTRQAK
jgi:ribose transport system permease protein